MKEHRNGGWIQTATGRPFWPIDPRPEDICIEDVAHALSNLCRFTGHCKEFYSVAQHSVLVSHALPAPLKLWGLLHDASEAYLIDVPRPIKPHLAGYEEAEARVMDAVVQAFGLAPATIPPEVKRVDAAILADEAAQIMLRPPMDWNLTEPALGIRIDPWSPPTARRAFLEEFEALTAVAA
ncbi:hypothetical protein [Leisingera daeponensis]|uniref:hypothetical protein n=1 Tax=Leisingera daeponensis TaxID=405746 RepID=UPI001C9484FD|nr:hypothetical protein [Leisingera daeponensis]MBY6055354.1 hypothetical protein [Leisingera daeponensis]